MYNKEELEKIIKINNLIYCDTNIAMSEGFEYFVKKFGHLFKRHKKKMIIIADVYQELLSKAFIGDDKQKRLAIKAVETINGNSEIFEVETKDKISRQAFADPKLLARLIENKANTTQLLITRDRGLSIDAKKFNSLNSVDGKQISVCYVNEYGNMKKFTRCEPSDNKPNVDYVTVEKVIEKPVIKVVKEKPSFMNTYIKPVCIAGITYVILDNKEVIAEFVKETFEGIKKAVA